jgi:peptide deformylase
MFELMYQAKGIGLAANQVDLPFQLFVINPEGDRDSGQEMVFINPVLKTPKGSSQAEEGCLSLPGVYGQVARPEQIHVTGFDLQGNPIDLVAKGLMARVIQHEFDHLQGTLFIDRMEASDRRLLSDRLYEFELELQTRQESGTIPDNQTIKKRIETLENQYC